MYELTVDSHFSSAHCLDRYDGDCSRMHGHNWKVSLTVGADSLNDIGLGLDFKRIASRLDEIVRSFDHRVLNDIELLRGVNPSAENIARVIFDLSCTAFDGEGVRVLAVTVEESERYRVTYRGAGDRP